LTFAGKGVMTMLWIMSSSVTGRFKMNVCYEATRTTSVVGDRKRMQIRNMDHTLRDGLNL